MIVHPFIVRLLMVRRRPTRLVSLLLPLMLAALGMPLAHAQTSCQLGKIREQAAPMYPVQLRGRVVEGTVNLLVTFAPDGRVSSSKVFSGPSDLRFEAEAYVRGWHVEKSSEFKECTITLDFRFDGAQGACPRRDILRVRPERVDAQHVILQILCDTL